MASVIHLWSKVSCGDISGFYWKIIKLFSSIPTDFMCLHLPWLSKGQQNKLFGKFQMVVSMDKRGTNIFLSLPLYMFCTHWSWHKAFSNNKIYLPLFPVFLHNCFSMWWMEGAILTSKVEKAVTEQNLKSETVIL